MSPTRSIAPIRTAPEISANASAQSVLFPAAALVFKPLGRGFLGAGRGFVGVRGLYVFLVFLVFGAAQIGGHETGVPLRPAEDDSGEKYQNAEAPSHPFSLRMPDQSATLP
jgi:hypothetical protein